MKGRNQEIVITASHGTDEGMTRCNPVHRRGRFFRLPYVTRTIGDFELASVATKRIEQVLNRRQRRFEFGGDLRAFFGGRRKG